MKKVRKGDEIIVRAGKSKGQRGVVLVVKDDYVTVEAINIAKKAVKPNPEKGISGGFESVAMPLHISNVGLVDSEGKPSRVRIEMSPEGKKQRVLKTTQQVLAS